MAKLRVDIWSDIACPWCYIGKRRIEGALAGFEHRDDVEIVWRAFELDPSAPRVIDSTKTQAERIASKYGTGVAQAQVMVDRVVATAKADGLDFQFDKIRSGNTFDAHRLIHLAGELGKQDALKERLMRAYLTEGQAIGEPEVLTALAIEVGLPADQVRELLAGDRFAAEVRADEVEARQLGISGVPFFVIDGRLGVSGAQPADVLRGALAQGWTDAHAAPVPFADGATCGPDGC